VLHQEVRGKRVKLKEMLGNVMHLGSAKKAKDFEGGKGRDTQGSLFLHTQRFVKDFWF
jgi:hypothetical protein